MRTALLLRRPSTDQGTFGSFVSEGFSCVTGELPFRDNIRRKSCIPVGDYLCEIINSPKFGRVYEIRNVQGRSHVLLHSGNFCGNTDLGWQSHVEGCILVAKGLGRLKNKFGDMQNAVLISQPTKTAFMKTFNEHPFTLMIRSI